MILEIRTYRLVPGEGPAFLEVMNDEVIPLLQESGIDVVRCGLSLIKENGHEEAYLLRAFSSVESHAQLEDEFYTSDRWMKGPRKAVVSRITDYHSVVIEVAAETIEAMRC
jgi:NIPSNAP